MDNSPSDASFHSGGEDAERIALFHASTMLLNGLSLGTPRDDEALSDMEDITQMVAARATQREQLCASLVDSIDGVHAAFASTTRALEESEAMRVREAALAHQSHEQLAGIEQRAADVSQMLRDMESSLAAEQVG